LEASSREGAGAGAFFFPKMRFIVIYFPLELQTASSESRVMSSWCKTLETTSTVVRKGLKMPHMIDLIPVVDVSFRIPTSVG
jgi:hypothetical protein